MILILCYGDIIGQEPFYWQLTEEDGLPSMTVYQVHQDRKGFMWFGTENGICRYDGKKIETFDHPNLIDSEILTIEEDQWGKIWFRNLAGQLAFIENGKIHIPKYEDGSPMIEFIIMDSILFSMFQYYGRDEKKDNVEFIKHKINSDGEFIKPYEYKLDCATSSGRFIKKGNLILCSCRSPNGILEINLINNNTKVKSVTTNFSNSNYHVENISLVNDSTLFLTANSFRAISTIEDDVAIKLFYDGEFFYDATNKRLGEDINDKKNNQFKSQILDRIQSEEFWQDLGANTFAKVTDSEGNLWMGSTNKGVLIFPNLKTTVYSTFNSKLIDNQINILVPNGEQMLVGHPKSKLSVILQDSIDEIDLGYDNIKSVKTIALDSSGMYWLGGNGNSSLILDQDLSIVKRFHRFSGVKYIYTLNDEKIWISTRKNIFRFNPNKLNEVNSSELMYTKKGFKNLKNDNVLYSLLEEDYIEIPRVYSIFNDINTNTVWIGSYQGIYKYQNQEVIPFLEGGVRVPYSVSAITQSKDSIIWVTTLANGLLGIQNDSIIHKIDQSFGLASNNCKTLSYDKQNDILWIGTKQGLNYLDLSNFQLNLIDRYDGIPSNEITAFHKMKDVLWIGTQKGLVKMPFSTVKKNKTPPPIYINKLKFWERDTTLVSLYDLPYNKNNIKIEFVGLTYRNRGNTNYQYRMLGLGTDTSWINTTARSVLYPFLNSGDYEFQVKAINEDGVESTAPAKVNFTINPAWWKTWWFYLLSTVSVVGGIGGFLYRRFQRIRKEEKKQQEFNDKINELKMIALQAQMNPHFVFNALSAIQKFLTTNEQEQAMIYLARFAKLIRTIFEQSKEKFITLDEELEFLKLYLDLEKLRFKDKVNINLQVKNSIQDEDYDIQIPPLLIQPIVENAFKHGLMHREEGGKLDITFNKDDEFIFCEITDNGVGRIQAKKMGEKERGNSKSSGLKTAKERLNILNNSILKETMGENLIIKDLEENGKPLGTKVQIKIKYNNQI